jgi:hypothetical protein
MRAMPTYFFNLKNLDGTIYDPEGMDLPDESAVREHARVVACELMQHRQPKTRSWRLDVRDREGRPCFELLFAAVDESIGYLRPDLRSSLERLCADCASLSETIHTLKLTLLQIRGTIARSEGTPYIVAVNGREVGDGPEVKLVASRGPAMGRGLQPRPI